MSTPEPPPPPPPSPTPAPIGGGATGGNYPARLQLDTEAPVPRWGPLVQWFLAIPHWFVASALLFVGQIVAFIAWFVILFTGKLPDGFANLQCMVLRYLARTYSYGLGLVTPYPPFEFATTPADPGVYPARVDFEPALEGRNRLTVGLRLIWAIPAAIVAYIIAIIAFFCWLIGIFAVLFTGGWPGGLRSWVEKGIRAYLRLYAYMFLLTDEYPPLSIE
jgi:hypothetical protein